MPRIVPLTSTEVTPGILSAASTDRPPIELLTTSARHLTNPCILEPTIPTPTISSLRNQKTAVIASIDIGQSNFAVYVEEVPVAQIRSIVNKKITPIDAGYSEFVEGITAKGRRIFWEVINLNGIGAKKPTTLRPQTFISLSQYLQRLKPMWDGTHAVVIEQQRPQNPTAIKLAQHVYSFFILHYGTCKYVEEFPASYKTKMLGAPRNTKNIKKWCIERAREILIDREDTDGLAEYSMYEKKDDMADTLCQLQAFKVLMLARK